jgi:uncharacterized membrane protein YbhN (UPF0104 family)
MRPGARALRVESLEVRLLLHAGHDHDEPLSFPEIPEVLIATVDGEELLAALGRADPVLAGLGIAAFAVMVAIDAWRFRIAFRRYRLSYRRAAEIQAAGFFLSNFTPGMAGADILRVGVAHRIERGLSGPIALAALLRICGMAVMGTLILLWALVHPDRLAILAERIDPRVPAWSDSTALVVLAVLAGLASAAAFALSARVRRIVRGAWEAVHGLGVAGLAALLGVTVLVVMAGGLSLDLLARAVSIDLRPTDVIVVLTLLTVGSLIPLGPGGLGLREGAITGGLVALGAVPAAALAVALLHRVGFWIVSLAGWVVVLRWRKIGPHDF